MNSKPLTTHTLTQTHMQKYVSYTSVNQQLRVKKAYVCPTNQSNHTMSMKLSNIQDGQIKRGIKPSHHSIIKQERPAVADKPARRLRNDCTVHVRAVGL